MVSESIHDGDWAKSLVGRDWEIFWSEEEDNENAAATDKKVYDSSQIEPKKSSIEENDNSNSNKQSEGGKESDGDSNSVGSIIDDWYAGRVVSAEVDSDAGKYLFKIRFVGDAEIYEMSLDPSKVRPSARGWIKRTKALLCCNSLDDMEKELPPDTRMLDDQGCLNDLRMEMDSYCYVSFNLQLPEQKEGLRPPLVEDVKKILNLRYLLRSQLLLRSRLATIVNHHGSSKYYVDIGGAMLENPTENFLEILVQCCTELDRSIAWYLRCWELLVTMFGGTSEALPRVPPSIDIDKLLHDLEYGKICLVRCATMDITPTASKRRLLSTETSPSRRPKRRSSRWGNGIPHDSIDIAADRCDLCSTNSVDQFVETLCESEERWFQSMFAKMLQTLSHIVVGPIIRWQRQSQLYIGETELANELGDGAEDGVDASSTTSSNEEESSGEEEDLFFCLEEIELCYNAAQTNPVLAAIDLDEYNRKLQRKINDINSTAARAKSLLRSLAEAAEATTKDKDDVLVGLGSILEAAHSPGDSLVNVEPIGKADSPITRALLSSAMDVRSWLLDVWHAQRVRERFDFIEKVASKSSSLPNLSTFESLLDITELNRVVEEAKLESRTMVTRLTESSDLIEKYRRELELGSEGETLSSMDGADVAMNELLSSVPCLSIVEEKIAVHADLLSWSSRALSVFEDKVTHNQLETLNKELQEILAGNSQRRMELVHGTKFNPEINRAIGSFASADSVAVCGGVVDDVTRIYSQSAEWKQRADAIVQALRAHGNSAAGEPTSPSRLPAMVDIKRICDLLEDYDSIKVDHTGIKKILDQVCIEANSWTSRLVDTIADESLSSCLEFLVAERARRPKGLIMDPTRTTFDSSVDFLSWHSRVRQVLSSVSPSDISHQKEVAATALRSVLSDLYPLLVEGIEALEIYNGAAIKEGFCSTVQFDTKRSLSLLESLHGTRRSSRAVRRERLESHAIGATILSRITAPSEDFAQGCPLFAMLWLQWHVFVTKMVRDCSETSNGDELVVSKRHSVSISLTEAKTLLAQRPTRRSVVFVSPGISLLEGAKTTELARLDQLVQKAEVIEGEIRDLLLRSNDMSKNIRHKSECVRQHLSQLKAAHLTLRSRSLGKGGLSLDTAMEPLVDHHLKNFTWLARTLPFPLLHLDEVSFSSSSQDQRIPFDVLISLFDRMPYEVQNQAGDFALISLRVQELYTAAKKWQDEITRNTAISFRGGKRRAVGSPGASEPDQEASRLQMEQMKKLAENPILSKVKMPREGAVNGILESSSQFEVELQNFLGTDFAAGGYCSDRAPYPSKNSLVGENGEFVLFRLTGSPLFGALHTSLNSLSKVGGNLVVETPGKATFDWIKDAVAWIEQLSEAITSDSPFDNVNGNILVIPGGEAREILSKGETVFLNIPEDLKRTLSKHGIFVTTNRLEKTIRVTLKKDGAHHSVGGTVIRWCPILFECLKSDTSRLDDWEKAMTETLADFNAFFSKTRDQPKTNQENLYKWFCYREKVCDLLQEGQESLVISPQKGLVVSFHNLLTSINNYLKKHCPKAFEKDFARKWFAQSSSLVDDRFLLLDSVLYRTVAADGHQFAAPSIPLNALGAEKIFRDVCRDNLENCLKKAVEFVGLDKGSKSIARNDMNSHCAMIAWEVELEMFERFQGELGIYRISDEYRNKARSLKNLEGKSLALCLRILTGSVDVSTLINMSAKDLDAQKATNPHICGQKEASHRLDSLKKRKALAIDEQDHAVSSGEAETLRAMPAVNSSNDAMGNESSKKKRPLTGLKSALRASKHKVKASSDVAASQRVPSSVATTTGILSSDIGPISASDVSATMVETNKSSPADLKALMKASKKARPPPPPSLAASFQVNSTPHSSRGTRLVSRDGSDSFRIEIGNPRSAFHSALYLEDDSIQGMNRFLSETLGERGRLPSEEFCRFLRDKLAGGRWQAISLRVATIAEEDTREYKKFYKEYETRNRIAMFEVGQNSSKLFLVTPKYHDAARMAGLHKLSNSAATYAVVLTKEIICRDTV